MPVENDSLEIVKEAVEAANLTAVHTMSSVADTNRKTLGDGPAIAQNMVYSAMAQAQALAAQNAVAQQQQMNSISNAATSAMVDKLINTDPMESVAVNKMLTGNDQAASIQALLSALSAGGIGTKNMQTVPPVTAPPPAV